MSNSFNPSGVYGTPIFELNLGNDLILTGKALTNGAEESNPSIELDVVFRKDDEDVFTVYFEDSPNDFSTLNSYLSSGLDLKQLPEDFGNSLDIVEGSSYQVCVRIYGFDIDSDFIESQLVVYSGERYFNNNTLNDLWKRLVKATESMEVIPGSWQLTEVIASLYIQDNQLCTLSGAWLITTQDDSTFTLTADNPI